MAGSQGYELAQAYVAILPSLKGVKGELQGQLNSSIPSLKNTLSRGLGSAISGSASGLGKALSGSMGAFSSVGKVVAGSLGSAVRSTGSLFRETMSVGAKAAGATLAASVGAVGGQIAAGGLKRALGINQSEAKLKSLGYQGKQFEAIMSSASAAIDGTRFTMDESIGASSTLLAAGIKPGKELEGILKNIGKLSDISGTRSFGDMASIFSKNAASGVVQMDDLNQLIDSGIAILPALAKQFNVTGAEVKKMASAGKISFGDFNKAIEGIQFDSEMFSKLDVTAAFNNVRAQLSKIGAQIWTPLIAGAGPVFNNIREALIGLQKNEAFKSFIESIQKNLKGFMDGIVNFSENLKKVFSNSDKISGYLENLKSKFSDFKGAISGLEGPIAGLGLALGSKFLGQIPVIGGIFGGVTAGAGLLGGALVQMYSSSDLLQGSIGKLLKSFKDMFSTLSGPDKNLFKTMGDSMSRVVDAISKAISGIDLSNLGKNIDFGGIFSSIADNMVAFIDTIVKNKDAIGNAFKSVGDTIQTAFKAITALSGGDNIGETLGKGFVTAIEVISTAIQVAVPVLAGAAGAITTIVGSDLVQGLFSGIVELAKFVAQNQGLMTALGGTLAALFVAKKLSGPLAATMSFFKSFTGGGVDASPMKEAGKGIADGITGFMGAMDGVVKAFGSSFSTILDTIGQIIGSVGKLIGTVITSVTPIITALGGVLVTTFEVLGSVFASMVGALATVGGAVMSALPELAVLGLFIAGVGALGWALEKMGVFDIIANAITFSIDVINSLVTTVGNVVGVVLTAVQGAFDVLANGIGSMWSVMEPIFSWMLNAVTTYFDSLGGLIQNTVPVISDAINSFMETAGNSINSLLSGFATNGLAAGAGLAAVGGGFAALAAGLTLLAGANAAYSLSSLVPGQDVLTSLGGMLKSVSEFNTLVSNMPTNWASVAGKAYEAGKKVMSEFNRGLLDQMNTVKTDVSNRMNQILDEIQVEVNAKPINIRYSGSASYGAMSGFGNTTTNNYNLSSNNSSVIDSLMRQAR